MGCVLKLRNGLLVKLSFEIIAKMEEPSIAKKVK